MPSFPTSPTIPKRALGTILAAALAAALLVIAAPAAQAQNQPPQADAGPDKVVPLSARVVTLDGTRSFDIDSTQITFRWSVVTPSYTWLEITHTGSPIGSTATFVTPLPSELAQHGNAITFRLTVTDTLGASHSDDVVVRFEAPPTGSIDVAAYLPNPNATDLDRNGFIEDDERYTIDAILGRPNQGDNNENEWEVREGARLILRGTASAGTSADTTLTYRWRKISAVPNRPEFTIPANQVNRQEIAVILPDDLQAGRGAIVNYGFVITGASGVQAEVLVTINVIDQPFAPEVDIELLNANQPVQDANAIDPEADVQRYVVAPGRTVQLIARASDGDTGQQRTLVHAWSGPNVTATAGDRARGITSQATFTAPADAPRGQSFTATVQVTDSTGRTGQDQAIFIVADNKAPEATAPPDDVAEDGPRGGTNNQGLVILTGSGSDPDGDLLSYRWVQVDEDDDPLEKPTVKLLNANEPTVAFATPLLTNDGIEDVHLAFIVADQWGVGDTDTVTITILGRPERPVADAGIDQIVEPNTLVRLDGTESYDPDPGDRVRWAWEYVGFATTPPLSEQPLSRFDEIPLAGFVPRGEDYDNYSGLDPFQAGKNTGRPTFVAPNLGSYTSVQLTFKLTVTDLSLGRDSDTVTVTVTGLFFSGTIDGPEFCTNHSLGGPRTLGFDSDRDGVADVCSLPYTRREAVARQNALTTLASLSQTNFRTKVLAACNRLSGDYGDRAEDLATDACATRTVSDPPPPVAPAQAQMFFSGVIDGPDFCTNLSLGGPRTYAFDGDGDGVADVCSLPYTRREAVARQEALESFTSPEAVFDSAVALACRALGATTFAGDTAAALARDACA